MIEHKKVEVVELFYDLVFVYAISQITGLIHHLHDGAISLSAFFAFSVTLIIYINTWMIQTIFINRFGISNFRNIGFMLFQMFFLIMASVTVKNDWQSRFVSNMWPWVIISLILLVQYIIQYIKTTCEMGKQWIRPYFAILGTRTLLLFIALCFPYNIGIVISTVGILSTWILPGIFNSRTHHTQQTFHFPHLIERLSLLSIIMFGEMLIGIVPYFSEGFSWIGFFAFFTIAHLFISYIIEFDHMIDTSQTKQNMLSTLYWHYCIFFGLSLMTVGLGFIGESANPFTVSVLYGGLTLILCGVIAHSKYNRSDEQFTLTFASLTLVCLILGYLTSLYWISNPLTLMITIFITVSFIMILFFHMHLSAVAKRPKTAKHT